MREADVAAGAGNAVRPLEAGDRDAWHGLWRGYCAFYGADVADAATAATWARLGDPDVPMLGLVAVADGRVVGILNAVLHLNTWTERPVCYLEDLFVAAEARGRGVGRALIAALVDRGRAAGWHRVYWMTKRDNAAARALYDSITPVTDWVRYDVPL